MKKWLYCLLLSISGIAIVAGQSKVVLEVKHLLLGKPFEFNTQINTNAGVSHTITRLDYFISNIKLHHSNGVISLPETYLYIGECKDFAIKLGDFDINRVDSISFAIGIDSLTNHSDPTLWPTNHALSLFTSDMHWGWAGGYRFLALEGKNKDSKLYQIHALGDQLYKVATIVLPNINIVNNELRIVLQANMENVTAGLDMNTQIWEHGPSKEAKSVLFAMTNNVFKPENSTSSNQDFGVDRMEIYPNPTFDDHFVLKNLQAGDIVTLMDRLGRVISEEKVSNSYHNISCKTPGTYIIALHRADSLTWREIVIKY
jgi:hypothetical protein